MVLMRKRAPRIMATALRAYTSGLVFMGGGETGVFIGLPPLVVACEFPM